MEVTCSANPNWEFLPLAPFSWRFFCFSDFSSSPLIFTSHHPSSLLLSSVPSVSLTEFVLSQNKLLKTTHPSCLTVVVIRAEATPIGKLSFFRRDVPERDLHFLCLHLCFSYYSLYSGFSGHLDSIEMQPNVL